MPGPGHATARGRLEGLSAPHSDEGSLPFSQSTGGGERSSFSNTHLGPSLSSHDQRTGLGFPARQPAHSRQLVRFRASLRPKTIWQPEHIPEPQLRSTAEMGFRVPKLSSPRERDTERDVLLSARRRRLIDVRGLESVEAVSNKLPNARKEQRPEHSRLTYTHVVSDTPEGFRLGGQRDSVWKSTKDQSAKISIDTGAGVDETTLKRLTDKGINQHLKLDEWYQGLVGADADYRSSALFLEVKMRELLGEDWADAPQTKHPPLLRATVCVDLLGRLVRSIPGLAGMGEVLWREVVRSVFEGGVSNTNKNGGWGEAYFDKVKGLELRVAALAEEVQTLRAHTETPEDRARQKANALLSRILGRTGHEGFRQWRQLAAKNNAWKGLQRQMHKRHKILWTWKGFYSWVAACEKGKRQRWQTIAEMLKWDQEYSGINNAQALALKQGQHPAAAGRRAQADSPEVDTGGSDHDVEAGDGGGSGSIPASPIGRLTSTRSIIDRSIAKTPPRNTRTPPGGARRVGAGRRKSISRQSAGVPLTMQQLQELSRKQEREEGEAAEAQQREAEELQKKLVTQRARQDAHKGETTFDELQKELAKAGPAAFKRLESLGFLAGV